MDVLHSLHHWSFQLVFQIFLGKQQNSVFHYYVVGVIWSDLSFDERNDWNFIEYLEKKIRSFFVCNISDG